MESKMAAIREEETEKFDSNAFIVNGGGVHDLYGEDTATEDQPVTPWMRCVASGTELLRDPRFNKGLAFTAEERNKHYLRGLLPPSCISQDLQMERILMLLRSYKDPLQKYIHMMDTQDRNERLFYYVVMNNVEELMPVIYTPTVGEACQKLGEIFHKPRGLYISLNDRGSIVDILKNWSEKDVRIIVVTDGERILGLGDLGVQGMGIPVGKLALYTALGGIRPSVCLPIALDVGTNNHELLNDPFYIGLRKERVIGKEYDNLLDEFMLSVKKVYGEKVLVHFEDFGNQNAFRLLERYRKTHLVMNDDIQGTAAVVLAGLLASLPLTGGSLSDKKFLFFGAGEAGTGIAELIVTAISKKHKISLEEARKKIWLVDSKGLVVKERFDSLQIFKKPFAHEHEPLKDLLSIINTLKPSVLIGSTSHPNSFDHQVLKAMATHHKKPIIFALSNPTSKSECNAHDAYEHTQGRAIFASGSPFDPVQINEKKIFTSQANNAYIFPGIGLGVTVSGAIRFHDEMLLAAAEALAEHVTEEDRSKGLIYPPLKNIHIISAYIAAGVAKKAYSLGLATKLPEPRNMLDYVRTCMYKPVYRSYR